MLLSQSFQGHTERVRWVSFSPDGNFLASSSDDGTIKIWEIHTGRCLHTLFNERPYELMNITSAQGLTEAQKTALGLLGAIDEDV
jgi:WD40 repeat protein